VLPNQEDCDLLIAYNEGEQAHLVIVEAKGLTGWTVKQMLSKAKRLSDIFGFGDGQIHNGIVPHFILASPKHSVALESKLLMSGKWPNWMTTDGKIPWVKLTIPDNLLLVSRSDASGKPDKKGEYWTVLES